MKIAFISDMHGNLNFSIKPCDLLIICGDICPCSWEPGLTCLQQETWLGSKFKEWFNQQPIKECAAIAGNHDWIWDIASSLVPNIGDKFHYLCDSEIEILGLKIYGTPQQKYFNNWAFNRSEEQLIKYFDNIPEGLDILVTHTPPYKILDKVDRENFKKHEGDKVLKAKLSSLKNPPKINAFGHFHGQYGIKEVDYMPGIKFINCSLLNEKYIMDKKPIYLEI